MLRIPCIILLSCLTVAGCSGGAPPTHKVTGTISMNGQPVADAEVGFIPAAEAGELKPARGRTDSDGRYTLTTYLTPTQQVNGAMAGPYQVTVTKGIAEKRIVEYDDLEPQRTPLPPKYADATTTPLTAEVTADGNNTFDFTLKQVE